MATYTIAYRLSCLPLINIMYYFNGSILAILDMKILIHPRHQMILKGTFDELVE
jgi:hypothetical protein